MEITINFGDFEPWGQAKSAWEQVVDANKLYALESYLDELYPDGMRDGDLNDLLAHESGDVLAEIGILESSLRSDIIDDINKRIESVKDEIKDLELEQLEYDADNKDELEELDDELTSLEALLENDDDDDDDDDDDELLEYKSEHM